MSQQAVHSPIARGRKSGEIFWLVAAGAVGLVLLVALMRLLVIYAGAEMLNDGDGAWPGAVFLIVFIVGTVTVAGAIGAAVQRQVTARHVAEGFEQTVGALDEPAAVTTLDGVVIVRNEAMALRGAIVGQPIERILEPALSDPRRQLFRLTRAAILDGFGIEPIAPGESETPRYLVAQVIGRETMLWRFGSKLEGFARSGVQGTRFIGAPFAHLMQAADGTATVNQLFEQLFGAGRESIQQVAALDLPRDGGRAVISGLEGRNVAVRSFVIERQIRQATAREILLFPIRNDTSQRSGLAGMLDVLPVALAQVDVAGRILWANTLARAQLGPETRLGMPLGDLVEGLGRPIEARIAEAAAGTGNPRAEMAQTRRNAREVSLQLVFSRMETDGIPSIVVVMLDATELEAMKAAFLHSHKMEAVGKLAGGVAHDFNNVLTAIIGNTDLLLLRNEEGSRDHADLMQVKQNANRAAHLVRQLLAFSRKQTLKPRLLSVRDVISNHSYMLQRLIGERVTLRIDHAPDVGEIRADVSQIEHAIMNLVVNARDAMRPEGGAITISTRNTTLGEDMVRDGATIPPGDYVEMSVADQGPGIPEEVIGSIFEPFFTTKAVGEGTGLGLSTVYGIVKQSGGFVFASNLGDAPPLDPNSDLDGLILKLRDPERTGPPADEIRAPVRASVSRRSMPELASPVGPPQGADAGGGAGPGAQFTILLPRVRPTEAQRAAEDGGEAQAAPARDATGRGSIMLVEDEAPVRSFAARALKLRGYEVSETDNAEAALDMLANPAFVVDVLVSDVVMPGLDGPTFVREARRLRPGIRVVFISGYARDSLRKQIDGDDFLFLPKPFTLNELTLKVKEAIGR